MSPKSPQVTFSQFLEEWIKNLRSGEFRELGKHLGNRWGVNPEVNVQVSKFDHHHPALTSLNDGENFTFAQIADALEKTYGTGVSSPNA